MMSATDVPAAQFGILLPYIAGNNYVVRGSGGRVTEVVYRQPVIVADDVMIDLVVAPGGCDDEQEVYPPCPICGEPIDYCLGHGERNSEDIDDDPWGRTEPMIPRDRPGPGLRC